MASDFLLRFLISYVGVSLVAAGYSNLAREQCIRETMKADGDAQALITGLFDVRQPTIRQTSAATRILEDKTMCGPITLRGLQTVEGVRWAIDLLNQRFGIVFGIPVNDSFIPGLKIGTFGQ